MYKIIENNQIIDVIKNIKFIKFLPKSKRAIGVGEKEANGILSSNNSIIYHIYGTPNTFPEGYKTVTYEKILEEEYKRLTEQLKANTELEERVCELEKKVRELQKILVIED